MFWSVVSNPGIYRLTITDENGCTGVSPSVQVAYAPDLPAPSLIDINFSGMSGDTAIILVEGENTVWYDAPVGGNIIGSGSLFSFGPIVQSTTIYVASEQTYYDGLLDCSSERAPIQLIITSLPSLPGIENIHVAPNPVSDYLTLNIESLESSEIFLDLQTHLGQSLEQYQWNLSTGNNQFVIDLEDKAAGTYLLSFQTRQKKYVQKIIIQ